MKKLLLLLALPLSVFIAQGASAQTDLYIKSVSYQYEKTSGYVHVNVCNNGQTPNKTPRAHVRIVREGVWNVTEIQNIGNLKYNQCFNMKVNYNLPEHQTHQIVILLDPKSQLEDASRDNNVVADFSTKSRSSVKIATTIRPTSYIDEFDTYTTQPAPTVAARQDTEVFENPSTEYQRVQVISQPVSGFSDTSSDTLEGEAAVELQNRNIIQGYPDGEFKGSKSVNRAEIAKFLLLAEGISVPSSIRNDGRFSDVSEGEWYVPYIIRAEQMGILSGYPDGSFRPSQTVNTVEFLKLMTKTFGLDEYLPHDYIDVPSDAWYAPFVGIAQVYGLFPDRGLILEPARDLTRKEVAIAIYKILAVQ